MKFLVIEGLDGSGKSTQVQLLKQWLEDNNQPYEYLHFPRTDSPVYGELVARFLRGELGRNEDVNPYLVALLFAGDQASAADSIERWKAENKFVLVDRYVYSNIAYQSAKFDSEKDQTELMNWIIKTEFDHFKIPVPDLSLYLKVPVDFVKNRLTSRRTGSEREYLKGKNDIHEADIEFQLKVRQMYQTIAEKIDNLHILDCSDQFGNMMPAEDIFQRMIEHLKREKILK
ncbi:MAG: dTMP kinase [Bacteroidota bacterium]